MKRKLSTLLVINSDLSLAGQEGSSEQNTYPQFLIKIQAFSTSAKVLMDKIHVDECSIRVVWLLY